MPGGRAARSWRSARRGQGDRRRGQCHLHGDRIRDPAGKTEQRACAGEETDTGLGDAELRALRGDDQVTGQGDLQTTGECEALDCGDERLLGCELGDAGKTPIGEVRHAAGDERLQVHAGREAPALATEHTHRQIVVAVELFHRGGERLRKLQVHRVHGVRTVQGHQQDLAADFSEYFVGHRDCTSGSLIRDQGFGVTIQPSHRCRSTSLQMSRSENAEGASRRRPLPRGVAGGGNLIPST